MSNVFIVQLSTPVRGDADWLREKLEKMFGDVSIDKRASVSTFRITTNDYAKRRVLYSGKLDDYLNIPELDINVDERPHTSADYLLSGILGFYPPPFQPLVEHKELKISELEFKYMRRLYKSASIRLNPGDLDDMLQGLINKGFVEIFKVDKEEFVRFKNDMRTKFAPYARFTKLFRFENSRDRYDSDSLPEKLVESCNTVIDAVLHSDFTLKYDPNVSNVDKNGNRIFRIYLGEDYGDIIVDLKGRIFLRAGWDRTFVVEYDKSVKLIDFLNECFRIVE